MDIRSTMTVFVSTDCKISERLQCVFDNMKQNNILINLSPINPIDGNDERWVDWYSFGLDAALKSSEIFIILLTDSWESSSWMGEEASRARDLFLKKKIKRMAYIDLRTFTAPVAIGMKKYLIDKIENISEISNYIKTVG